MQSPADGPSIDKQIELSENDEGLFENQEFLLQNVDKSKTKTDAIAAGGAIAFASATSSTTTVRLVTWEYTTPEAQYYYAKQKLNSLKNGGWILVRNGPTKPWRRNRTRLIQEGTRLALYVLNPSGGWVYTFLPDPGL
jgi:hypothetical protein